MLHHFKLPWPRQQTKELQFASEKRHHLQKKSQLLRQVTYTDQLCTYIAASLSDSSVTNTCGRETRDEIYWVALVHQMRYNETQSQQWNMVLTEETTEIEVINTFSG